MGEPDNVILLIAAIESDMVTLMEAVMKNTVVSQYLIAVLGHSAAGDRWLQLATKIDTKNITVHLLIRLGVFGDNGHLTKQRCLMSVCLVDLLLSDSRA